MNVRSSFFAWIFCSIHAFSLSAQEPIRFARTPDLSPDGKLVAFSYLGDIWTVETIGGVARPITMHEAHDYYPSFSPDGRWIAFSSNRFGGYDVFVVSSHGGKPRRLTFDSANDIVQGWTPDGKNILFTSYRGTDYPGGSEVYSVSMEGGQDRKLPFREAKEISVASNGQYVAFSRGPGTWYRKNYRGSSNDDLWVASMDGSNVRRLTDFNGQDTCPMWSPDNRKLFYVSEILGGPSNIVCQEVTPSLASPMKSGNLIGITKHREDSVRRARMSANGDWIVYECGSDLWIVGTKESQPRKIAIEVHADDKSNVDRTVTFTRDITEYALSPSEYHVAFTVHGDIFLMPITGGKATRLTEDPAVEHGLSWSMDGKKILYSSDRGGQEDLYLVEHDDPEHPELIRAHRFKSTRLTNTSEPEIGASFSPDGNRIAFLRSGKLWTMKPDGTDLKALVEQTQVYDYDWSPDGKWIAYSRMDGSFASEVYITPLDGSQPPKNVSRYATTNYDVSWSTTGNKIAFLSQRRGSTSMHVLNLQKPVAPNAPTSKDIDWDDIHLRVTRPANIPADEGTISRNGSMIAFRSQSNGDDLWLVRTDASGLSRVTFGNTRPRQIRWSKNSGTIYFLDGFGSLRTASATMSGFSNSSTTPAYINFTAKMTIKREEEFSEMFEQSWRSIADHFYDAKHHGVDWRSVREKYQPAVKHVTMKEDLYALISLMVGELNASHLGISGLNRFPDEVTADLGVLFDESYKGPGFKIAELVKGGPVDKRGLNLKVGDILTGIDRTELTDKANLSQLLNNKVNEMVLLDITSNPSDPKAKRRVEIQATTRDQMNDLMYRRWINKNAENVSKLSKGTLGYIHIPSMDETGVEQFVRSLYSDNFDKEAIVLDVRNNGGGFTHDQILNYLGAKPHAIFKQRDGGEGLVMRSYDRKWTKPLVLLVNNRSYSDAEIFPNGFRTLGLGKVVGQPTGGLVIGTSPTRLIDGSTFRIPRTGVWTVKGTNMEKEGVLPDVVVDANPEELANGNDPQLSKAVELLIQDVIVWKKNNPQPVTVTTGAGGSGNLAPNPMPKK
jgi:tricorn protease